MDIKKSFMFLVLCIIMISTVSAFEFDNVKTYDTVTREVTIKNSIIGIPTSEVGGGRLNTPLINYVPISPDKKIKVGEFDVWAYDLYENVLKDVTFEDRKVFAVAIDEKAIVEKVVPKEITVDYEFRKMSYEKFEVDDYKSVEDGISKNGTISYKNEIVGSHTETRKVWTKIDVTNLKKDERITVGIFTTTNEGDRVEWIPTLFGVEVPEWAEWVATLNTDLEHYYNFSQSSSTILDSVGSLNPSYNGADWQETGKIGYSYDLDGVDDIVDFGETSTINGLSSMTIAGWIYSKGNLGGSGCIIGNWGSNTQIIWRLASGDMNWYLKTTSGLQNIIHQTEILDNTWHHVAVVYDGYYMTSYVDGVAITTPVAQTGNIVSGSDNFIFGKYNTGNWFKGRMDEFGIWERALSQAEITNLVNGGTGITWTDIFGTIPFIKLNSPTVDATYTTSPKALTFNFTVYDDKKVSDVKLYVNDILNQTNATGINNTDYLFDLDLVDGTYEIYAIATDNESTTNQSASVNFVIDTTPFIEFLTPPTLVNYANITQEYIPMKVNVSTIYFENITYNLQNINGTNITQFFTSETYDINFTDMPDAHYHYDVTICTTTNQCNTTETRHINHDATAPVIIGINITDLPLTYTLPINSTWQINATDDHLESCYYNTTDYPIQKIVTCNSSINTQWTTAGNHTLQYCANDTLGNEACNIDYVYVTYLGVVQQVDKAIAGEGMIVTFNATLDLIDTPTTTANFNFNGTWYPATSSGSTQNQTTFTKTLLIEEGWGNTTGITYDWFWNYTINGVVTSANISTSEIQIFSLALDDCSAYTDVILNMSLQDEETQTIVNGSGAVVEVDVYVNGIDDPTLQLHFFKSFTDDNNPQVCLPLGLLNSSQYTIEFVIGYQALDHVWEFFYMDAGILNGSKQFNPLTSSQINLNDLATDDSTSFLFSYFDRDGLAVENTVVHVFRKFIGLGTFLEVERAKGDQNGDTLVHLVEEDVIYYFLISQNGTTIYTSSTYTALCQTTPCAIQVEASGGSATFPTDWDLMDNGVYSIRSDASTRYVNMTWSATEMKNMNFTVYRYESDGSYVPIVTNSSSGIAGSILLYVPQSAGNVSFFSSVYESENFLRSEWVDFEEKSQDRFGITLSLFMAGLLILTLGLMAVTEGAGTLIFVMLGVLIAGALGLISTSLSSGVSIVSYLIIAGGFLLWKLTKGRQ